MAGERLTPTRKELSNLSGREIELRMIGTTENLFREFENGRMTSDELSAGLNKLHRSLKSFPKKVDRSVVLYETVHRQMRHLIDGNADLKDDFGFWNRVLERLSLPHNYQPKPQ